MKNVNVKDCDERNKSDTQKKGGKRRHGIKRKNQKGQRGRGEGVIKVKK